MFLIFQQAIAKLRLKLRILEVNSCLLPRRSTPSPAPTLFLTPWGGNQRWAAGWGGTAQHGDGSAVNSSAQALGSALQAYSRAVRSPATVGSLALELCYGFLLELSRVQGRLQGLQLSCGLGSSYEALFRAWQLADAGGVCRSTCQRAQGVCFMASGWHWKISEHLFYLGSILDLLYLPILVVFPVPWWAEASLVLRLATFISYRVFKEDTLSFYFLSSLPHLPSPLPLTFHHTVTLYHICIYVYILCIVYIIHTYTYIYVYVYVYTYICICKTMPHSWQVFWGYMEWGRYIIAPIWKTWSLRELWRICISIIW